MDSNTMSAITIRITFDCHYNDSCANQERVVYESFVFLRIRASNVLKFKVLAMTGAAYACKRKVKRPRISDLSERGDPVERERELRREGKTTEDFHL